MADRCGGDQQACEMGAVETQVALVQALIPVAVARVGELLTEEVARLAGPRYARAGCGAMRAILGGLSTREYGRCVSLIRRRSG